MHLVRFGSLLSLSVSFLLVACDDDAPSPGPAFTYECPVPADDVACSESGVHTFATGAEIAFAYPNAEVRPAATGVEEGELAFIAFQGEQPIDYFHVTIAKVVRLELDTKDPTALVITPVGSNGNALGGRLTYSATIDSDAATIEIVGRTIRVHALRSATVSITVKGGGVERAFAVEVKA